MRLPSVCGPDLAWECFGSCEVPNLWMAWCSAIAYQKTTQEHRGKKEAAKKEKARNEQETGSQEPDAGSKEHRTTRKQQEARGGKTSGRKQKAGTTKPETREEGNKKQDASREDA